MNDTDSPGATMLKAPIFDDEEVRLESLRALRVLDTSAEGRFDRITRLARRIFGVPISAVSLVDAERQWFKSIDGLCVRETPRDVSFCGHAIHEKRTLIVENALEDDRFADNPLVTGEPHIRFYAGHPVVGPSGMRVGTLCIIDREPRSLSENEIRILEDLAGVVENELSLERTWPAQNQCMRQLENDERKEMIDPLTHSWNGAGIARILESESNLAREQSSSLSIVTAELDDFDAICGTHGRTAADELLLEAARRVRSVIRPSDACGRVGGERFIVVQPWCDEELAIRIAERVRIAIAGEAFEVSGSGENRQIGATISLGVASKGPDELIGPNVLLESAERALGVAMRSGENRVMSASAVAASTTSSSSRG